MRILIVPGHGGQDKGTTSTNGKINESEYVLDIGMRLFDLIDALSPSGVVHGISRTSDDTPHSLSNRAKIARDWDADFVISLHLDYANNDLRHGLNAFYYPGNVRTEFIADQCVRSAPGELYRRGSKPRAATKASWPNVHSVLSAYRCDALLVEMGFLSNKFDVERLCSENVKEKLVFCLYSAILAARDVLNNRGLHYGDNRSTG